MPEHNIHERVPLFLKWMRQGQAAWRKDWVSSYGAARTHIPSLDEHVGFANFDLSRNGLPPIEKDQQGRLFIQGIRLLDEAELAEVFVGMYGYYVHPQRAEAAYRDDVLKPLALVADALDVVGYHGFAPAEETAGVRHLRRLFPPRGMTIEFPDGPEAGL